MLNSVSFRCPKNCSHEANYDKLIAHLTNDCPKVLVKCPYKCETGGILRSEYGKHREVCPNFKFKCPTCDLAMKNSAREAHNCVA